MRVPSLRWLLQESTSAVHQRLHRHPDFSAIADGTILGRDFDLLMARIGGFFCALDPKMQAACDCTPGLGDYAYRARAPMFPRTLAEPSRLPAVNDLPSLAGAAYVVDGSVLGGKVLASALGDHLQHPYWDWCAGNGPAIWRATIALIDCADTGTDARFRAVSTAQDVFAAFEESVDCRR